jgi:CopG family transcriptional regulator, nickel-responsive regulator
MKSSLVRFGLAMDAPLLDEVDALVQARGCTRSELFRDLARAEVARAQIAHGVDAVATLTLVYDHHVRDLSEKLNELQHELGEQVRSTLHVHLSHDYCLEVIVLRGRSDELQSIAERILATRGVKQGGIEIVSGVLGDERAHRREPAHAQPHVHPHADKPVRAPRASRAKRKPQPGSKRAAKRAQRS